MNCSFLRRKKRVFKIHWDDSLELQIKNELDPRIRFPASVFSHIISSACGVVVTHQLPNVFFCCYHNHCVFALEELERMKWGKRRIVFFWFCRAKKKTKRFGKKRRKRTAHRQPPRWLDLKKNNKNGEKDIRRAEEEEEEGERRARRGNGAVEARTDAALDGIGGVSQGCVCIACASEIE